MTTFTTQKYKVPQTCSWHLDERSAFRSHNAKILDKATDNYESLGGEEQVREHIESTLKKLKGTFAGYLKCGIYCCAFTDNVRSIPVASRQLITCNHVILFAPQEPFLTNSDSTDRTVKEFMNSGYVYKNASLDVDLTHLGPGQYFLYRENLLEKPVIHTWLRWADNSKGDGGYSFESFENKHLEVIADYIEDIGDSKIVIPLSGGFDSRLLLAMAKDCGVSSLLCFTFGKVGNKEAAKSRQVASYYGYDWEFVEYSPELWNSMRNSHWIDDFYGFCSFQSSMPHIMEVLALRKLLADGAIDAECTVMPGHALDFVAGTHIPKIPKGTSSNIAKSVCKQLMDKNMGLWSGCQGDLAEIRDEVENMFHESYRCDGAEGVINSYEEWVWFERQAKFIANSCRVYDYLGLKWRMPWWDSALVELWCGLDITERRNRSKFMEYLQARDPQAFNELTESTNPRQKLSLFEKVASSQFLSSQRRQIYRTLQAFTGVRNDPMNWYYLFDQKAVKKYYTSHLNVNSFVALDFIERKEKQEKVIHVGQQ